MFRLVDHEIGENYVMQHISNVKRYFQEGNQICYIFPLRWDIFQLPADPLEGFIPIHDCSQCSGGDDGSDEGVSSPHYDLLILETCS